MSSTPKKRKRSLSTSTDQAKRIQTPTEEEILENEKERPLKLKKVEVLLKKIETAQYLSNSLNKNAAQNTKLCEGSKNESSNEEIDTCNVGAKKEKNSEENSSIRLKKEEISLEKIDTTEFMSDKEIIHDPKDNSAHHSYPDADIDEVISGQGDINQTKCKICNKVVRFQIKWKLYGHYISHFEDRLSKFCIGSDSDCSICGKKSKNKRALLAHIGIVHKKLDAILSDDMKYENLIGINYKKSEGEKFSPIISKLIDKMGWPKEEVLLIKGPLVKESLKEFTVCKHCGKLVIGHRAGVEQHVTHHYYNEILRYPRTPEDKCNSCREEERAPSHFAHHLAKAHNIRDKVISKEELTFTKISEYLQEDKNDINCSKKKESKSSVKKRYEKGMKFISCQSCKATIRFGTRYELYKHYSDHYKERLLDINRGYRQKCYICDKNLNFVDDIRVLYRHIGIGHNEIENMLPEAMKYDHIMKNGLYHVDQHHKKEILDFPCASRCKLDDEITYKSNLAKHSVVKHTVAEKVIPENYHTFINISDFLQIDVNEGIESKIDLEESEKKAIDEEVNQVAKEVSPDEPDNEGKDSADDKNSDSHEDEIDEEMSMIEKENLNIEANAYIED